MFLINISLKNSADDNKIGEHREWFKRHFDKGNFVLTAPYTDKAPAGMIFADVASRAELDDILAEDCYFPDLAEYEVREFAPKPIAKNLPDLIE